MKARPIRGGGRLRPAIRILFTVALVVSLAACSDSSSGLESEPSAATVTLLPLSVTPEIVDIGDAITASAEGLPPGKTVQFAMVSQEGSYESKIDLGSIEFLKPSYAEARIPLGQFATTLDGKLSATFEVPETYGSGTKDIVATIDGEDVAKGGVYVGRIASISVTQGPVGTPITIQVKGLGASGFQSTVGLRWDNKYVGFMSSTTTAGTATAVIRATGPVGVHYIDLGPASAAVPYLNPQQTPRKITIPTFRFAFNVTADNGPPPTAIDWPDASRVNLKPAALALSPDWAATAGKSKVAAEMSPVSGPILSEPKLTVTGLDSNSTVDVVWRTVTGSDVSGWSGDDLLLSKATAAGDGTASLTVKVPEGLGGWHTVGILQDGKMVAEAPYFVERSLISANPQRVKAGEPFTVEIKGVGWTEFDNGVAVLYDNHYVGYACGFGSGGDVTVELLATGGPGTHLIELYPMIYNRGFSQRHYWNYEVPQLTYAQDHPGLSMGYKLPVFRLAITVE